MGGLAVAADRALLSFCSFAYSGEKACRLTACFRAARSCAGAVSIRLSRPTKLQSCRRNRWAYILRHLDEVLGRDGVEALTAPAWRKVDLGHG